MSANKVLSKGWPVKAVNPPKISDVEWALAAVPGTVLVVMAILQLVSLADLRTQLDAMKLGAPTFWAVFAIIAELWGAVGFFKLKLSLGFRNCSYALALLAAGFWFVFNAQLVANGMVEQVKNSGYFGRFLAQTPGWWTVIEVSILLFWVVYKVGLLHDSQETPRYK